MTAADAVLLLLDEAMRDRNPARRLRNALLLLLLAEAGLNCREITELAVPDVDLQGGFLTAGRGKRSRKIPLTSRLKKVLEEYLNVLGRDDGPLVPGKKGVMTPRAVQLMVSRLAARAGVKVKPSELTESFYLRMAEKGVGLEVLAALKGASKLDSVRRFAGKSFDFEKLQEAVRLLEQQ